MASCPRCGRESPDDFGFCPACGAELAPRQTARDVRKVVSMLFCDLTGSTAIGERTDPEALRTLMTRYYQSARVVLERHGGTVEKFVGDAVMAVFGIPVASEEDALRATRAAVEVREVVHALGLEARIGVNTGDVVAGEGDTLVTGDAVNVAARLEQAAGAGEILLGDATFRLVRDAIVAEPVELTVKGKTGPLLAQRLLSIDIAAMGITRRLDRPMLGREREQTRLAADFADAVAARTCRLFTLVGPAGVGKSRLVADFLEHVGPAATVAKGRALSYGEGITYWPLVEMLLQLGLDPDDAIRSSPGDTQLATRALLERIADDRPLVLVLDDVQWAEGPLLDLVEHIADWSRDAPIFLLCIGRPELLDVRPGWGGGKVNTTSILLEPLGEDAANQLADVLLADLELGPDARERILVTAEGNPLFLEELAALARESHGSLDVPPTIQAVLQARLDALGEHERAVIERGAVEGKVFHRSAVTALAPYELRDGVAGNLLTLVRKELVRPDRAQIVGDDAFRFRHLLIRDTAYESLPKLVRAELHELFADWLQVNGTLVEREEILGYHLEQAARYRTELDRDDPRAEELGSRATGHLAVAGRAAIERVDLHAARNLLSRAVALLPEGPARSKLLPELADVLGELGELEPLLQLVDELERGDDHDRAVATSLRVVAQPDAAFGTTAAALDHAYEVLTAAGDATGAARCERARGYVGWALCQAGEAHTSYLRAFELLRDAGPVAFRTELVLSIQMTAVFSGLPLDAIGHLLDVLHDGAEAAGPLRAASARAARARVSFAAGVSSLDELRTAIETEVALLRQTGSELGALWAGEYLTVAIWLVGDDASIEAARREKVLRHEAIPANPYLANALAEWALALCRIGDIHGARQAITRARGIAHDDDLADQILLGVAEATTLATAGDRDGAVSLVHGARARAEGIDMAMIRHQLEYETANVERLLGDVLGARRRLTGLIQQVERAGFTRAAARYRRALDEIA